MSKGPKPTADQVAFLESLRSHFETFEKQGYWSRTIPHTTMVKLDNLHKHLTGTDRSTNLSCNGCVTDLIRTMHHILKDNEGKRARSKKGQYKGDDPKTKKNEAYATGKKPAAKKKPAKKSTAKRSTSTRKKK